MPVNGIAGGMGSGLIGFGGSTGAGHAAAATPPASGPGSSSSAGTGSTGTTSGDPSTPSGGGVTFGTYVSFANYGSTPWIYPGNNGLPSTQGSASAAFPTSLASTGGADKSLQAQLDRLRVALLTALVGMARQNTLSVLMPTAFGITTPSNRNLTISMQVAPPSAAAIQQAYQPSATTGGSILSIVA